MSKIAIVGHPASGYQEVESMLRQCGMAEALPSRRDALSPQQITAALCKIHKAPPLDAVVDEEEIRQIDAGSVWHGMALDLMLGNLNQPPWGWADPQAIYTLNYWSQLDPQISFVLVFDEPHRVLMEAARTDGACPPVESLQRMLDNWAAYNGALLRFYLRHPGRCLLVHAQQAQRDTGHCVQRLQDLLDAPLAAPTATPADSQQLIDVAAPDTAAPNSVSVSAMLSRMAETDRLRQEDISVAVNARTTERYLADGVLANYPKAMQLYAELQSAASLPLDKAARAATGALSAWETWVRQRTFMFDLVSNIHAEYRVTSDALAAARKQVEDKNTVLTDLHRQIEYKQTEYRQENELLLTQLHQVQEDLDRHHLESQRLQKQVEEKNTELTKARKQAEHQQTESKQKNELLTTQLNKIQEDLKRHSTESQHLKKQVEEKNTALNEARKQAEHQQTESSEENEMLLSQLHLVQEELERYYIENQRIKKQAEDQNTALTEERRQASKKNEQLQTQLHQTQEDLKRRHAESQHLKKQVEEKNASLAETSHENERLLTQLIRVQGELERYDLVNQELRKQLAPPKPSGPVGAADRVKKQLSYRLGAVMIDRQRTLGGWLTMPWALMAEARAFRKERRARGNVKLPPIHTYDDAPEAERVKQHLSYRMGSVFLKHIKSPLRWFTMPFALRRELREFKRTRQGIP